MAFLALRSVPPASTPAFVLALLASSLLPTAARGATGDVVTYHNDTYRTGWFSSETTLTPANVNSSSFGLLNAITLDGRVDAEPLVIFGQPIDGQGTHDVVYVATEADTIFALDAESGATLWTRNFGTPVPYQYKDYDDNVFPIMGVLSTPVIDRSRNALYAVADTYESGVDVFRLHAIALDNGSDTVAPAVIAASEPIKDKQTWTFEPQHQLQRPALLEANGSIYMGFGSTGDIVPQVSRGLMLRYDAGTLALLDGALTDKSVEKYSPFYLSSIWQSGYGPAVDDNGNVYFSTGNSSYSVASYKAHVNYPDSVLEVSPDLSTLLQSFTPSDYFQLDQGDVDLGSGGTMVLPDQSGALPHLAIAGGKDGRVWLLDRDKLGGFNKSRNRVLDVQSMGSCWCGPAYYVGSDAVSRIVTGGGNGVTVWKLTNAPRTLVSQGSTGSTPVNGLPDNGGTVPVVSSNGTTAGTAVAWFVQRPAYSSDYDPGTPLTLWAYDPNNLAQPLFSAQAGTWVHAVNSNADLVPTVAGGHVYVASNKQLQIYGLLPPGSRTNGKGK